MRSDWLWDRKIADARAKKILSKPESASFFTMAALLLSRKNEPREVFKNYLNPIVFCRHWPAIKRRMRQDKWSEPRIIFWQAIYEKLSDRYRKKGMVFRQEAPVKKEFCETIGKKMAAIRREQGLSQKGLAKRIGISQQIISRIESGGENISLITLTRVADALKRKVEINFLT
ncbi:MAG: helix-turn-helix transcriptional regulator [Candidatus Omnitrophica bacterium]|nr:helix-turn-helix transcriptional regulator [Candidatus Omnitrophota bacterium]